MVIKQKTPSLGVYIILCVFTNTEEYILVTISRTNIAVMLACDKDAELISAFVP